MKVSESILKQIAEHKAKIEELRKQLNNSVHKINCKHKWVKGYTLDAVVFCELCNKDWDEVFIGMSYNDALKLVDNENN